MGDPKDSGSLLDLQTALGCRLLEGDSSVLGDILREFGPRVEKVLERRFPSFKVGDLEDVLMIALDRLWKSRNTYDDSKCSLRGWLYVIANSAAKDVLDLGWHRARQLERVASPELLEEVIRAEERLNTPAPNPTTAKRLADLDLVLNNLNEEDRRIILAYACSDGEGEWAADLANEIGTAAGTIRVKRGRILERIKTQMRAKGHQVL